MRFLCARHFCVRFDPRPGGPEQHVSAVAVTVGSDGETHRDLFPPRNSLWWWWHAALRGAGQDRHHWEEYELLERADLFNENLE